MNQSIGGARNAPRGGRSRNAYSAGSWLGRIAAAAALGSALGCATTPAPEPPIRYPAYEVGAPDQLTVTILPEPLIVEQVVVRPDGKITIQLVGDVQASGRTLDAIAGDIQHRIGKFKRGAVVTVKLASAASSAITILGEVRGPRSFALTKQMRVTEALGVVGGTTNFANEDEVRIVRPGEPTQVYHVDLAAIRDGDLSTNIQVFGGDIVYVPPTFWARVGYVVQALLFPIDPLLGVARSAAGSALVP